MLSHDLSNLSLSLAEAARSHRVSEPLVAEAARQLAGHAAMAALLEAKPVYLDADPCREPADRGAP